MGGRPGGYGGYMGGRGGYRSFSNRGNFGPRGGNFARRGNFAQGGKNWGHGRHHRHGNRFFVGVPFYDYGYYDGYYGGGCGWLYSRALATGSSYWWRRYELCLSY
jgi:hypothetical protein